MTRSDVIRMKLKFKCSLGRIAVANREVRCVFLCLARISFLAFVSLPVERRGLTTKCSALPAHLDSICNLYTIIVQWRRKTHYKYFRYFSYFWGEKKRRDSLKTPHLMARFACSRFRVAVIAVKKLSLGRSRHSYVAPSLFPHEKMKSTGENENEIRELILRLTIGFQ